MHFLKKQIVYKCFCGKFENMEKCEGFEMGYMANGEPAYFCEFYDCCGCSNDKLIEKYKRNEDV